MSESRYAVIFVTDAEGLCLYMSQEWAALTGQPVAQALGRGWTARVHPEDQATVRSIIEQASASATEYSVRYRVLGPNDQPCWIMVGCVPSVGPPGNTFLGYLGSFVRLADNTATEMLAYGNVGRLVPPPTYRPDGPADHLDRIADYLVMAHSLIETDGAQSALPGLRQALYEVGRALAARVKQEPTMN